MALTIAVNISSNDAAYTSSGAAWITVSPANDYFVFSNGSSSIADNQSLPSQSQLQQAGIVLNGTQQIVPYYFLADASLNRLWDIDNMGNQNKRYVMAFSFSAATASEPVLELWDDSNLNTIAGTTLGAGSPSNSWWRGVTTTAGLPGTNWTGSSLAGSGDGNYLLLNNGSGALSAATNLYCNLKIVVPASATTATSATPVFAIKYASN